MKSDIILSVLKISDTFLFEEIRNYDIKSVKLNDEHL